MCKENDKNSSAAPERSPSLLRAPASHHRTSPFPLCMECNYAVCEVPGTEYIWMRDGQPAVCASKIVD